MWLIHNHLDMFWVRDARNSQAEVDFVIRYKSHLLPIEVKTGNNSKLRSLHQFMEESRENIALRLWNGPLTSDVITRTDARAFTLYFRCIMQAIWTIGLIP